MGLILLLLFLGLPLIEIALFIKVGGMIGTGMTLTIVIVTAILGSYLLRTQGLATVDDARDTLRKGELPLDPVIHGVFLVIAGAFLLTPGFLTDTIGFLLFVPSVRLALGRAILRAIMARGTVTVNGRPFDPGRQPHGARDPFDGDGPIIDGEAFENDGEPDPNSPWSRD